MDKRILIEQIQSHLLEELEAMDKAKPDPARVREIELQLNMYRFLPARNLDDGDVACAAALVELEFAGTRAYYFIVPQGGGLVTSVDGKPVQVVTPGSPIGGALLGRKVGDSIDVEIRGTHRKYKVVSIR